MIYLATHDAKGNIFFYVYFTSWFSGDRMLKSDMVDFNPHLGGSLFQLPPGEFALAVGREESLSIWPRGRGGLRGHGAQLTPLAEPAEGNNVRVEMWGGNLHADDIWRSKEGRDVVSTQRITEAHQEKNYFFWSYLSHFVSQSAEFLTPLVELNHTIWNIFSKENKKDKQTREKNGSYTES